MSEDTEQAESGSDFALTGLPDRFSQGELAEIGKQFKRGHRAVRRWIALGRKRNDPCPVSNPGKLLSWWRRNMKQMPPARMVHLAVNEAAERSGADIVPFPGKVTPIDLQSIDADAALPGESVRRVRRLVKGVYSQLETAFAEGSPEIDSLSNGFAKASDLLRKLEAADREAQRQRGRLVPVDEIQRDAAAFAEMLKAMRETMAKRVLELCPEVPAQFKPGIVSAIEKIRANEDKIFARFGMITDETEFNDLLIGAV